MQASTNAVRPLPAQHARGVLLMLASAACFTANVLLIRALGDVQEVSVWLVSCVRFTVGLAVVAVVYRNELRIRRLFTTGRLATRGVLGGMSVYTYYLTIVHLGPGRATFIGNTYVIFGALFAVMLLAEPLRPVLAAGGCATMAGLALLTNAFAANQSPGPYDLLAVLTAVASGYIVVTIRQLHATDHTSTIFAAQCVYGLLLCAAPLALHPETVSLLGWAVVTLAGITAAAGQIAMTLAFRDLPVAEGSLLQMLVPLGTAAGGALFFRERFAPHELFGAALILGGTAITALRRQPEMQGRL